MTANGAEPFEHPVGLDENSPEALCIFGIVGRDCLAWAPGSDQGMAESKF
jgi:hypothetical protein